MSPQIPYSVARTTAIFYCFGVLALPVIARRVSEKRYVVMRPQCFVAVFADVVVPEFFSIELFSQSLKELLHILPLQGVLCEPLATVSEGYKGVMLMKKSLKKNPVGPSASPIHSAHKTLPATESHGAADVWFFADHFISKALDRWIKVTVYVRTETGTNKREFLIKAPQ